MGGLGFKDIELFNMALLARQVWRILQSPETLSARILRAVYFLGSEIMEACLGSTPSQIWPSIVEGRDILKLGLIRIIGDGASTSIWQDNWIARTERLKHVVSLTTYPLKLVSLSYDGDYIT